MRLEHKAFDESAVLLCHLRTFTDIPYTKEIAIEATKLGVIPVLKEQPREVLSLAPRFESRFKGITNLIQRHQAKSILEIAVGLSTRGLILTQDPAVTYVETDLPSTIEAKQQIAGQTIGRGGSTRPNLKFAAVDILNYDQLANAASYISGPVTVVSEGLIGPLKEKFTLAAVNIHRLLSVSGGVWISSEWGTRSDRERSYGASLLTVPEQMKPGEHYLFENDESVLAFLAKTGFRIELVRETDLAGELTSIERLGLDKEEIQRRLYGRNVYVLSPI